MTEFENLLKKLEDLTTSANASCKEFTNLLIALGFQIENCGSAGHKIAKHPVVLFRNLANVCLTHTILFSDISKLVSVLADNPSLCHLIAYRTTINLLLMYSEKKSLYVFMSGYLNSFPVEIRTLGGHLQHSFYTNIQKLFILH